MNLRYESIAGLNKEQARLEFASGDVERIVRGLLGVTQQETDWEWVERRCLEFLESAHPEVCHAAISCLGDLARLHGRLNKSIVLDALRKRSADTETAARIEDAIEDIEMFAKDRKSESREAS